MFMYSSWMRLPLTTRTLLATHFGFSKTGPTHVQDNVVVADGYKISDIEAALNVDAIQKYVGSESTDLMELWTMMVDKVEGRAPVPTEEPVTEMIVGAGYFDEPATKTIDEAIEEVTVALGDVAGALSKPEDTSSLNTAFETAGKIIDTITKPRRGRPAAKK